MISRVAKLRETPYAGSAQVTGLPSCHRTPFFSVNVHVLPWSLEVPVSVARSGTGVAPRTGSAVTGYVIRPRYTSRSRFRSSRPPYVRCGSRPETSSRTR
jgi:hypothetical protein